jgi:hypothetical protein
MSAAVMAVRITLPDRIPTAGQFGIAVAAGALTYALVMYAGYRARLETLVEVLRELRR